MRICEEVYNHPQRSRMNPYPNFALDVQRMSYIPNEGIKIMCCSHNEAFKGKQMAFKQI
jgi:hypothetical protein